MDLNQILENMTRMAKDDGQVTNEEEMFLSTLRKDIEQFQESANYATQDDYISEDQLHDLIILRDRILTSSLQFSTESEEVDKLVNGLYNEINEFMIPGMDEDDMVDS
ncbi:MAG: hypothetical protein ACW99A_14285 [Candidatus Kariarchaeaceae archaeon]